MATRYIESVVDMMSIIRVKTKNLGLLEKDFSLSRGVDELLPLRSFMLYL